MLLLCPWLPSVCHFVPSTQKGPSSGGDTGCSPTLSYLLVLVLGVFVAMFLRPSLWSSEGPGLGLL